MRLIENVTLNVSVDATNGRAYYFMPYNSLTYSALGSTKFPIFKVSDANYEIDGTNVSTAVTAFTNVGDGITCGASGVNLATYEDDSTLGAVSTFDSANVVSAHTSVKITGVNTYDKKGMLYAAEVMIAGSHPFIGSSGAVGASSNVDHYLTNLLNDHSLTNLRKAYHFCEHNLANTTSTSSVLDYNYIPEFDGSNYSNYARQPQVISANLTKTLPQTKGLVIMVDGAASGTVLTISHGLSLQLEPKQAYLSTYPVAPKTCYASAAPILNYLGNDRKVVLQAGSNQNYLQSLSAKLNSSY